MVDGLFLTAYLPQLMIQRVTGPRAAKRKVEETEEDTEVEVVEGVGESIESRVKLELGSPIDRPKRNCRRAAILSDAP